MKFVMYRTEGPVANFVPRVELAIVGVACDDRGRFMHTELSAVADKVVSIQYDPDDMTIEVDGERVDAQELDQTIIATATECIVDATTLSISEMVPVLKLVREGTKNIVHTLYAEPMSYRREPTTANHRYVVHKRDFEITEQRTNFQPIPGHQYLINRGEHRVVFFAGYEGERMSQALEEHDIEPEMCGVVFGIPAYKAGWEMDSFANHVKYLESHSIGSRVHYSPADNPRTAFELLEKELEYLAAGKILFVAPLGTKPQAVGVAAFLAENPAVGLLYDHPRTATERTTGIGRLHVYTLEA